MPHTRFVKQFFWTVLAILLILAVVGQFAAVGSILLLIFAGMLFGLFVHGIASWPTRRTQLPYRACYFATVAILLLILGVGFLYLGSQIGERAAELRSQLKSSLEQTQERIQQYEWADVVLPDAGSLKEQLADADSQLLPRMMAGLRWVGWAVTGALVIFFVGLYAAYEPQFYRRGLIKLADPSRRENVGAILDQLQIALQFWIIGRLLSMSIIGILTAIGLYFLGVPLPITLGVVAACLTFIPNIGPLLAAIPQILLALEVGTSTVIYVAVFNVVLQGVESYLITPIIQRHEVKLPPIFTITAQLVMGVLFGIIGVMMAAPLVVVAIVLVQRLYIRDTLGDIEPSELTVASASDHKTRSEEKSVGT